MATNTQARAVMELISDLIKQANIVGFGVQEGLSTKSGAHAVIYLSRRTKAGTFPYEVNGVPIKTMVIGKPRPEADSICFRGKAQLQ